MRKLFKFALWAILMLALGIALVSDHEDTHRQICTLYGGMPSTTLLLQDRMAITDCVGANATDSFMATNAKVETQGQILTAALEFVTAIGIYVVATKEDDY